jgi:hypothetical protein
MEEELTFYVTMKERESEFKEVMWHCTEIDFSGFKLRNYGLLLFIMEGVCVCVLFSRAEA